MNITLIAAGGWHSDSPGGAYRLPSDFARFLVRRGRYVAYLCPSRLAKGNEPEHCDGVDVYRYSIPTASSPSAANLAAHLYRSRRIAAHVASRGRVEALLGHSPLQYLGALLGCHSARKCYTVHSPFAAELRSNCSGRPSLSMRASWRLAERMDAYIYRKSDVVQCFSNFVLGHIKERCGPLLHGKSIVLPAWVDTDRFVPSPESPSQVRWRMGAPWRPHVITFVTVRRLVPRMGLDILLDAAAILSGEALDFHLVIGGDGPELSSLREKCLSLSLQDQVSFLGGIPEEQLVDIFRAGNCFVLPTRSLEGFGLVILEAYACGTPVIAVPIGAIPEVMGPSFLGWLAASNSAAALADRMREVIMNHLTTDRGSTRRRALEFRLETVASLHERMLLQGNLNDLAIAGSVKQDVLA